jgi:glucosamine-phosphate N-acetyltransferase
MHQTEYYSHRYLPTPVGIREGFKGNRGIQQYMVSNTDLYSFLRMYNNYDIHEYVQLLTHLSIAPRISTELFHRNLESIMSIGTIIIAHNNDCIVGTGTVIIEPKLIRAGQCVGHIEDIVVHPDWRGHNIAATILRMLKEYAVSKNCYKVILDCIPEVQGLYTKCGYYVSGIQMAKSLAREQ